MTNWPRWRRRFAPFLGRPGAIRGAGSVPATGPYSTPSLRPQNPPFAANLDLQIDLFGRTLPPLLSLKQLARMDRFMLEAICRAQSQPLFLGDHLAITRALSRYKLFLDTRDRGFTAHVLLDGYWEMWLTIFLCRRIKSGMVVVDVGANFGYYTLLLADLVGADGHAFAIEPNPAVSPLLRQSVALNGFSGRTSIVEAAAGDNAAASVLLYSPYGEFKNACIIDSPDLVNPNEGALQHVQQISIDDIVSNMNGIDFLKIDAEGSEEIIIEGMDRCISDHKPSFILEFNAARCKEPNVLLNRLISSYKKVFYLDFDAELVPTTEVELLSQRVGEDWLLFFDRDAYAD